MLDRLKQSYQERRLRKQFNTAEARSDMTVTWPVKGAEHIRVPDRFEMTIAQLDEDGPNVIVTLEAIYGNTRNPIVDGEAMVMDDMDELIAGVLANHLPAVKPHSRCFNVVYKDQREYGNPTKRLPGLVIDD